MDRDRAAMLDHAVSSYARQNSKKEGAQFPSIMDHNIYISPEPQDFVRIK